MTACKTCATHINDCDILDDFECAACLRTKLAAAEAREDDLRLAVTQLAFDHPATAITWKCEGVTLFKTLHDWAVAHLERSAAKGGRDE